MKELRGSSNSGLRAGHRPMHLSLMRLAFRLVVLPLWERRRMRLVANEERKLRDLPPHELQQRALKEIRSLTPDQLAIGRRLLADGVLIARADSGPIPSDDNP